VCVCLCVYMLCIYGTCGMCEYVYFEVTCISVGGAHSCMQCALHVCGGGACSIGL
jgi:hypothetical protein